MCSHPGATAPLVAIALKTCDIRGNSLRSRNVQTPFFFAQEGRGIVPTHGGVHLLDVSRTRRPHVHTGG